MPTVERFGCVAECVEPLGRIVEVVIRGGIAKMFASQFKL
jgi:hypothetical protein